MFVCPFRVLSACAGLKHYQPGLRVPVAFTRSGWREIVLNCLRKCLISCAIWLSTGDSTRVPGESPNSHRMADMALESLMHFRELNRFRVATVRFSKPSDYDLALGRSKPVECPSHAVWCEFRLISLGIFLAGFLVGLSDWRTDKIGQIAANVLHNNTLAAILAVPESICLPVRCYERNFFIAFLSSDLRKRFTDQFFDVHSSMGKRQPAVWRNPPSG